MDTKLKKSKRIIGFIAFFMGISLLLNGFIRFAGDIVYERYIPDPVWDRDYQNTSLFRDFIGSRLESFLAMATGAPADFNNRYGWYCYNYTVYDGSIDNMNEYDSSMEYGYECEPAQGSNDNTFVEDEYGSDYDSIYDGFHSDLNGDPEFPDDTDYYQDVTGLELTKEQVKKHNDRMNDKIKDNKNLLYIIENNGEILYSNTNEIALKDHVLQAPGDYNFTLYFDGSSVTIQKDGKETDVYGDGYYKDSSKWYVPGYKNFVADEALKNVKVYMAAAKEPLSYAYSNYARTNYKQAENELYYIAGDIEQMYKNTVCNLFFMLSGILCLIIYFLLRKDKKEADHAIANFTGKLWFEIKLITLGGIIILCFISFCQRLQSDSFFLNMNELWNEYSYESSSYIGPLLGDTMKMLLSAFLNSPFVMIVLFWCLYLVGNDLSKNSRVFRNSITYKFTELFHTKLLDMALTKKMVIRYLPLFLLILLFGILSVVFAFISRYQDLTWIHVTLLILLLILILLLQYRYLNHTKGFACDLNTLKERIKAIKAGNYSATDNTPLDKDLNNLSSELDDIRLGMEEAVNERMKSEHMKVELITNVSHDIKTPLTSIISYVDLLKEEQDLPEHVKDFIRILDKKAKRLNHMIQDVFSISKAASGELPVKMEYLDFGKLLRQTMADMDEQIERSSVLFKADIDQAPVIIKADGQRMYRVFQNLIQNAIKYSLEGSRVYITLTKDACMAIASIKNTSRHEINSELDFTERFVRGDESRTDGGSGLGLSIAQSFTEACGGSFHLETIADLFVVTVTFPLEEQTVELNK